MLDPNYPLYSCRNNGISVKHVPIALYGLNNMVVLLHQK